LAHPVLNSFGLSNTSSSSLLLVAAVAVDIRTVLHRFLHAKFSYTF
jgi:hypothetical protein